MECMRKIYTNLGTVLLSVLNVPWKSPQFIFCLLLVMSLSLPSYGQVGALTNNALTPMTTNNLVGVTATSSQIPIFGGDEFDDKNNIVDASLTNASNYSFLLGGDAWIEVNDPNATGGDAFPAGSYAGVVISDNALLSVLGSFTIETFLGASPADNISSGSLVSTSLLSGVSQVGFITTLPFNRIRFSYSALALGNIDVYYMVVQKFGPGQALPCNTISLLNNPGHPSAINENHTGTTGVTLSRINNAYNVISASTTDAATLTPGVLGALTVSSLAVQSQVGVYTDTLLAGFEYENTSILGLDLLQYVTINTYLNGDNTPVESATGENLLVSAALLQGSGRQRVSLVTTLPFDEIQIQFAIPVGLDLGTTSIYNAFIENFCSRVPPFVCNTMTSLVSTVDPVYINSENTSIGGVACALCEYYDLNNVIDGNTSTFATLDLTGAVGNDASLGVRNALDDYPANSFAGFDIQMNELLGVDVASGIEISMYRDGALVHSGSNPFLLAGVGTTLLTGELRQRVGLICPVPFDEVVISFETLADVSLGIIRIYDVQLQVNCGVSLDCNETYALSSPDFPVVIDFERTGVFGAVCAGCEVDDVWNLLDANLTNFARINTSVGTLAQSTIAILDPIDTYYPGTYVGFTVRKNGFAVSTTLLPVVTIRTYNNGIPQETVTGGGLIDLTALFINIGAPANDFYNIGFQASLPFDEVSITYGGAVSGLDNFLEIYTAFIDNSNSEFNGGETAAYCLKTNPDFNVGLINLTIEGDVSTNDIINDGPGIYSDPVADPGNPGGGVLVLDPSGSYTFTSPNPGIYIYDITVCAPGQITPCPTERLTITIKDNVPSPNVPTANTDIATVNGDDNTPGTVIIPVQVNDEVGNPGGTLDNPTIVTPPANGSVVVNIDGTISYTPDDGFYGTDVFTYEVCETPGGACAEAIVVVTVMPPDMTNTTSAADDFVNTPFGVTATGNVATNDTDPEGHSQSVSPFGITLPGQGTFTLLADGSYTFIPASGFFGSVDIVYTICDSGSPQACADATLHILVQKGQPDFTPTNDIDALNFITVGSTRDVVVNIGEVLNSASAGQVMFRLTKISAFTITYDVNDESANVFGGTPVNNTDWTFSESGSFITCTLKPGVIINGFSFSSIGFTITRNPGIPSNTVQNITATIFPSTGGDSNTGNNTYVTSIIAN